MTTMSKNTRASDALRSGVGLPVSTEGGRALANAAETWFAAATECQREMMNFVSARLDKDAETTREMIGCKNLTDIAAIQSRWIEESLRDYNSEMTKLIAICTKSLNGGGQASR